MPDIVTDKSLARDRAVCLGNSSRVTLASWMLAAWIIHKLALMASGPIDGIGSGCSACQNIIMRGIVVPVEK